MKSIKIAEVYIDMEDNDILQDIGGLISYLERNNFDYKLKKISKKMGKR